MKLSLLSPAIVALLGFMLVNPLHAADAAKPKGIPGRGKLKSVDASAQTVTLEGKKADRVFSVTPETKIIDGAEQPTTLAAAKVGEDVGIYYTKDAGGKMTLMTLRLGAKVGTKDKAPSAVTMAAPAPAPAAAPAPAPAPAPAAAAPEKAAAPATAMAEPKAKKMSATGKVVSVDAAGNTIVVHGKADQTFTVAPDAKITGAANLAAITAGEHVKLSYTKSADGATLTASTVAVGK